jgi:hypothetical protein
MKEEILSIASDLREGSMTTNEATLTFKQSFYETQNNQVQSVQKCRYWQIREASLR